MLWLARCGLSLMPTTAMVFALRSISSMIAVSSVIMIRSHLQVFGLYFSALSSWFFELLVQIIVCHRVCRRAAPLRQQISAQKRLQIPVEHLVHIANFNLGAVVLCNPVGLQHIRPNLRAEVDFEL